MICTTEENRNKYTQQQYAHTNIAGELYHMVGHPLIKYYKSIIRTNEIKNCSVTTEDIDIYEKIFGNDTYTLKGTAVHTKPKAVVNYYIEIPQELKYKHQNIELFAN